MKKSSLFIISFLVGCTPTTPYQKESASFLVGGYTDQKISDSEYTLLYRGTIHTSYEQLESMWYRRAAELCPSGFEKEFKRTESPEDYSIYLSGIVLGGVRVLPAVEGKVYCN